MKKNIHNLVLFPFLIIFFNACTKDNSNIEIDLAYQIIGDKTWFLESIQTTVGNNISTNNFIGQPTYYINLYKNRITKDSDGITGNYSFLKSINQLQISIVAKTVNGSNSNYSYQVVALGDKQMILLYANNISSTKYFYSTRK